MRVVHVGKIYRVSKNESGYLLWIPKKLADELGIKYGDRVALMSDGSMIVIVPADKVTIPSNELEEVGIFDKIRDTR